MLRLGGWAMPAHHEKEFLMPRYSHLTIGLLTALGSLPALAQINCAPGAAGINPVPVQVSNAAIANSRVNPQINQRHIFCGEINNAGQAVGFHSRPGSHDPILGPGPVIQQAASIAGGLAYIVPPGNNHPGPYRYLANVRVWNQATNAWVAKFAPSTFYPDSCSQQEVIASIRYAYMHPYAAVGPAGGANLFSGPSAPAPAAPGFCTGEAGNSFTINGYLNLIGGNWWLNTGYPIANF